MPRVGKGVGINYYDLKGRGYAIIYPEILFSPGGEVTRWYKAKRLELKENLHHYAPLRTGRLRRSIKVGEHRSGPLARTISVRFGVKYAAYTDQGTTGPITAHGKWMPVGKSQGASGKWSREAYYQDRLAARDAARMRNGLKPIKRRARTPLAPGYTFMKAVKGQDAQHWVRDSIREIPVFSRYSG